MAIYWTRTAEIAWGKEPQAIEWGIRIMKYLNDTYPERPGQVLTNVSGKMGEIHWVRKHESLADMEKYGSLLEGDEKFNALVKEMIDGGLLLGITDRLYQVQL